MEWPSHFRSKIPEMRKIKDHIETTPISTKSVKSSKPYLNFEFERLFLPKQQTDSQTATNQFSSAVCLPVCLFVYTFVSSFSQSSSYKSSSFGLWSSSIPPRPVPSVNRSQINLFFSKASSRLPPSLFYSSSKAFSRLPPSLRSPFSILFYSILPFFIILRLSL